MTRRIAPLFILAILALPLLASAATLAAPAGGANKTGLVGYWSFDEGTSTIAHDFSGNGNAGTLTLMANPPTATSGWGNGRLGKGLNFDGVDDIISATGNSLNNLPAITASAWINARSYGENGVAHIFNKSELRLVDLDLRSPPN